MASNIRRIGGNELQSIHVRQHADGFDIVRTWNGFDAVEVIESWQRESDAIRVATYRVSLLPGVRTAV